MTLDPGFSGTRRNQRSGRRPVHGRPLGALLGL